MAKKLNMIEMVGLDEEPIIDYQKMHDKALVRTDEKVEIDPAIQMGWYTYKGEPYPIPFGSYGDYSCIVGPSKSMKTFLKTAIVSCYLGGRANGYFPNIKGVNSENKYVIELDTEQSRFHVKRAKRTIKDMVGTDDPRHIIFQCRPYNHDEICGFLDWICYESVYKNQIGMIIVDGAADLVEDTNDGPASKALAKKFMKITDDLHCHLITILHSNFGSKKPTGHLGSAILKKAETIAFVERNELTVKVTPDYCRNYPFREFSFTLDDNGIPIDKNELDNIFKAFDDE